MNWTLWIQCAELICLYTYRWFPTGASRYRWVRRSPDAAAFDEIWQALHDPQ